MAKSSSAVARQVEPKFRASGKNREIFDEDAKKVPEVTSTGRVASHGYIDIVDRASRLLDYIDPVVGEWTVPDAKSTLKEQRDLMNFRLRMTSKLIRIQFAAIDGYLSCFGGREAIAMQVVSECVGFDSGRLEVFDRIARIAAAQSKPAKQPKPHKADQHSLFGGIFGGEK